MSGNIRRIPGIVRGKSDGPRFASRVSCPQSLRIRRARRRIGRFRQRRFRSARLCQSRAWPPQRRAARSARIAVDGGARQGGVRLSVRDPAGPRRRREGSSRQPLRPSRQPRRTRKGNGETCRSAASRWTLRPRSRGEAAGKCPLRSTPMRRWPDTLPQLRLPRRCSPMRQNRRRNRSTSFRRRFAPRRWRGCSAASSPIAASSSGWWCSGPIISASPPTRAGWRGCGRARSSARRSGPMCSGASATC